MQLEYKPLGRRDNIVIQELKDEILIYDIKTNKAFCLNKTSAFIYQLCDGTKSINEINNQLSISLKTDITKDLVWMAIDQLREPHLLENDQELTNKFEGLSRRQLIRRVGLTSIVMLPLVASIVAPTAAMASSAGAAGNVAACGTCTTSADCATGAGTCKTAAGGAKRCSIGSPNGTPGSNVSLCSPALVPNNDCQTYCNTVIGPQECCSGRANFTNGTCVCA